MQLGIHLNRNLLNRNLRFGVLKVFPNKSVQQVLESYPDSFVFKGEDFVEGPHDDNVFAADEQDIETVLVHLSNLTIADRDINSRTFGEGPNIEQLMERFRAATSNFNAYLSQAQQGDSEEKRPS